MRLSPVGRKVVLEIDGWMVHLVRLGRKTKNREKFLKILERTKNQKILLVFADWYKLWSAGFE